MIKDDPSVIEPTLKELKKNFNTHVTKDVKFRVEQLKSLARGIRELREEIQVATQKDLGYNDKFFTNFLQIDPPLAWLEHEIKHVAKYSARRYVDTNVGCSPGVSYLQPEPFGVVLVLGAWNYPLVTAVSPAVQAIAAGNAVVLKPSELTPHSSNVIRKLFEKYLDQRFYRVIEGAMNVAVNITKQPFDLIIFTGGTEKGKLVAKAAAENLTPVILELGGKSPCVIDGTVDLGMTCRRMAQVKLFNQGQTCIAPDYVLVKQDIKEQFLTTLKQTLLEFYGEDPKQSGSLTSIVNEFHTQRILDYLKDCGGQIVVGGKGDVKTKWIEPTVVDGPNPNSRLMQDEIFGPILPVLTYKSDDDAISFINARPKPLALYYFGNSQQLKDRITNETSAGAICFNECAFHIFNPNLPFGGVGNSGTGSLHGQIGFDQCCHLKPVLERSPGDAVSARYPPYTDGRKKVMGYLNKYSGVMLGDIKKIGLAIVTVLSLGTAYSLGFFAESSIRDGGL